MADDSFAMGYALGNDNNSNNGCGSGMWGGEGAWFIWVILIFAIFGWGRGGFGGGNGGGDGMTAYLPYLANGFNASSALTRADLCQDMNFQEVKNGVAGVSDAVALGFANLNSTICNQQYDTAQMINAMNVANLQTANAQNIAQLQSTNAIQAQLAQCCCDEKAGLADLKYTIASEDCATRQIIQNGFRDSIEATNAGTRAILDYLCQEKIADLQNENQALRLSASQTAQNQYLISQLRPTADPAFIVPNPFTGSYFGGYGYGGYGAGCGCGTCNTCC